MTCRTGCPTPGKHKTWGECVRASNIQIGDLDATVQKRWDKELDMYRAARVEGIQPRSTRARDVETAVRASDEAGTAVTL